MSDEQSNERDDKHPPVTYTHSKVARTIIPPDMNEEELEASRKKIGKMITSGFDEYYRLEMLGYRLMRPDEMIDDQD